MIINMDIATSVWFEAILFLTSLFSHSFIFFLYILLLVFCCFCFSPFYFFFFFLYDKRGAKYFVADPFDENLFYFIMWHFLKWNISYLYPRRSEVNRLLKMSSHIKCIKSLTGDFTANILIR